VDYIRQSIQRQMPIFGAKIAVSGASNQRRRTQNYTSDPRCDDASYIAQHTLTPFLPRVIAVVKRGNYNRRSLEWQCDTRAYEVEVALPSDRRMSSMPVGRVLKRDACVDQHRLGPVGRDQLQADR
jgi:hypothetical protein